MTLTSLPNPQQPIADRQGMVTRPWYMALVQFVTNAASYIVGPSSSLNNQIVLFDGTSGTQVKGATGTGVVHATSGVYSASDVALAEIVAATAPSLLIGRRSGSAGDWEEVSLDASSLSMSASAVLSALSGTGAAISVLGRSANSSGVRADIQLTANEQIFARRSDALVAIAIQSMGYWAPITNGDPAAPELIFDSFGDIVVGWVAL